MVQNIMKTELKSNNINLFNAQKKFFIVFYNFSGFDIPLDAFSLHHPFLRSHVTEFEFSAWYFLFFSIFYKNSSVTETVDVSLVVPDLASALSSKLSVPASVFSVSKAEKYRSLKITFHNNLKTKLSPPL